MRKYLIEYEIGYNNKRPIGQDDIFAGEGVFYIKANKMAEAKVLARKMLRKRFVSLRIMLTRVEEALGS